MPKIHSRVPESNPYRERSCQVGWLHHRKRGVWIPLPCRKLTCDSKRCKQAYLFKYVRRLKFRPWEAALTLRYPRRSGTLEEALREQHAHWRGLYQWMVRNLGLEKYAWSRVPRDSFIDLYLLIDAKLVGDWPKAIGRNGFDFELEWEHYHNPRLLYLAYCFFIEVDPICHCDYGPVWVRKYLARCDGVLPEHMRRAQTNMPELPELPADDDWKFVPLLGHDPRRPRRTDAVNAYSPSPH